jgi:hypothetical protein
MGFRFRRSIKILPGIRLNLSRSGVSTSVGVRGAHVTIGHGQVRETVGIPGTGLSYTQTHKTHTEAPGEALPVPEAEPLPDGNAGRGWLWILLMVAIAAIGLVTLARAVEPGQLLTQTQNPNAVYRLFNTENIFTLLLLNTTNGSMERVQWGKGKATFHVPLAPCFGATGQPNHPGRYTLHATQNIWTFILLDQDTGSTWYVQWSMNADNDFCVPIKSFFENIAPTPQQ